jgi:hypothetical protein
MTLELAIADVLEKAASYIEAVETEKQAEVQTIRKKLISSIREKVSATTGEDISEDVVGKLAQADPVVLYTLEKLALSNDSENLGSPSTRPNTANIGSLPISEQVKLAEDRLVKFAIG